MKRWLFRNLANMITGFRFLLTLGLIGIAVFRPERLDLFFICYLVAGLSDYFDGIVAERLRIKSHFGATLDIIVDKILYFSLAVLLPWRYYLSADLPPLADFLTAFLFFPVIAIEACLLISGALCFLAKTAIPPSNWYGRKKVVGYFAAISIWLFALVSQKYWGLNIVSQAVYLVDLSLGTALFLGATSILKYRGLSR